MSGQQNLSDVAEVFEELRGDFFGNASAGQGVGHAECVLALNAVTMDDFVFHREGHLLSSTSSIVVKINEFLN